LVLGTALQILVRYQNETLGHDGKRFNHPFFQSFVNSFGHVGGFAIYYVMQKLKKKEPEAMRKKVKTTI